MLHYAPGYVDDDEVMNGMYDCLLRLVEDPGKRAKVDYQLEDFKARKEHLLMNLLHMHLKLKQQHIGGNLMEVNILKFNGSLCEYLV
jgi:hypothetical protein